MKRRNNLIFFILFMSYTFVYVSRINLSVGSPSLMETGRLDAAQIGLLGSLFSTIYSVGRLVNGHISDTVAPRKMIVAGMVVSGISNIGVSFMPPFAGILALWVFNAFAQSMLWSSVLCVLSTLYNSETLKRKTAVMVTSVAVGNILGIILNTYLITKFGVRFAFAVPGAITAILGICAFVAVGKCPSKPKEEQGKTSVWELVKNKDIILMCLPAFFHGAMKENISLWMSVYIVNQYLVDLKTSSYYVLLIPMIGLAGRMVYPFLLRVCRERENRVSLIGFAVCIPAAVLLCMGHIGILTAVFALGIIYMAASVINTSILSIYPLRYTKSGNTASVSGIFDFATYLGAGISSAAYGTVIESFGYFPMFASWVIISVLSAFILLKIDP